MGLTQTPPKSRLFFERLVKRALKCCELWVFLFQRSLSPRLSCGDVFMRRITPINPATHLLQAFARALPALLTVLALLLVESVSETDPKSTAKQDTKNGNNDGVGLGAAVFRVIKAWTPIVNVFAVHERTR